MKHFLLLLFLILVGRVQAQERHSYNTGAPRWSAADIEQFIADSGLEDSGEAAVVRALYQELVTDHQQARRDFEAKLHHAYEAEQRWKKDNPGIHNPDWELGIDFGHQRFNYEYQRTYEALESEFLDTVERNLSGDAHEAWVERRRDLHRRHFFRDMGLSSYVQGPRSTGDLIQVVDQLQLPDGANEELDAVLDAYRLEMDHVLRGFRERSLTVQEEMWASYIPRKMRGTEEAERRLAALLSLQEQSFRMTEEIAHVNDLFVDRISGALDEESRARFGEAIDRRRFPAVFATCPVEMAVTLLRESPEVNDDQRGSVEEIWENYQLRRGALRQRMIQIQQQFETPQRLLEIQQHQLQATIQYARDDPDGQPAYEPLLTDHPAQPLFVQSRELAESACRDLRALFTDSEFAAMPLSIRLALEWWK